MDIFGFKSLLIALAIFIPLERLFAMHPGQKLFRDGWRNDLIYVLLNGLIIKTALTVLIVGIISVADSFVPTSFKTLIASQSIWIQIVEVIVLADIGFYFTHRAFHAVPWLWRFHSIHHSIEELDWLAAARVHPVDQILTKGVSLLPVFSFGFSEAAVAVWFVIFHWQSFLIHANVRISFGPLRWFFASPQFHHWHHSSDRVARDRNFAAQLPLLDALFGTLYLPRGKNPAKYGIDDKVPKTYLFQLLYPFQAKSPQEEISSQSAELTRTSRSPSVPD